MKLEIGSEKKVLEFISNLKKEDKIALISHTDLDGIVCAKIITSIKKIDVIKFLSYDDINQELVSELKNKDINKIIFTDINVKDKKIVWELEKFAQLLIIDHHISEDLNSEKTIFILGEKGYSTGYLCYNLFSKIKDLEKLDWLVACSCISDYCHIKPKKWLEKVFEKYGDKLEYEGTYVRKSGVFWDLQYKLSLALIYYKKDLKKVYNSIGEEFGDIGDLGKYVKKVEEELEEHIKNFEKNREEFKLGYVFQFNPRFKIGSIVVTIISSSEISKVFVVIWPKNGFYNISIRRQDKKFDCVKFLSELFKGLKDSDSGGHVPAAGGRFRKEDLPEVRKRLGLK